MRDVKLEIMFYAYNESMAKVIKKHYTTVDRLCKSNLFFKQDLEVVCKRQFTDLKDKNDVEIYEGDIVTSTPRGGRGTGKFKVLYDTAYGSFICLFISWESFNSSSPESYPLGEAGFDIEVIGNIYENPELITK